MDAIQVEFISAEEQTKYVELNDGNYRNFSKSWVKCLFKNFSLEVCPPIGLMKKLHPLGRKEAKQVKELDPFKEGRIFHCCAFSSQSVPALNKCFPPMTPELS